MPDDNVKTHVENRADKQAAGTCVRKCCGKPAEDGDYCARHEKLQRKYDREYKQRRRAEAAAAGKCGQCAIGVVKQGSTWCAACLIRNDRLRKSNVHLHVENRSARIAKRLIPWQDSPQNEGRTRMRGGKRGAPTMEDRDRRDLDDIERILVRYRLALDEAYSDDTRILSKVQQASTRRAAHAGLALAVRLGMEALVNYGYEAPVLVVDEIGDSDDDDDT